MTETRALIVVRLSRLTDESTSPERQQEACEKLCAERGWSVVGVAEDLDVSASNTSPFERPALKKWLDRSEEYDVIVFMRVDRFVRRVMHLAEMITWSENHSVNLVSATETHFDLTTSFGQVIAIMVAVFAQMEADAISERASDAFRHNLMAGKYRGGYPPIGYIPPKDDKGVWRLVPWPETKDLLLSIIGRVIDGEKVGAVVLDLNEHGVMTAHDRFRVAQGQEPKGGKWRTTDLVRTLQSPRMLGQIPVTAVVGKKNGRKVRERFGEVIRNEDGTPIVRSEPLIDRDTFDRLQAAVSAGRQPGTRPYKTSNSPLLRVVHYGVCGQPFYKNKGKVHWYYEGAPIFPD